MTWNAAKRSLAKTVFRIFTIEEEMSMTMVDGNIVFVSARIYALVFRK